MWYVFVLCGVCGCGVHRLGEPAGPSTKPSGSCGGALPDDCEWLLWAFPQLLAAVAWLCPGEQWDVSRCCVTATAGALYTPLCVTACSWVS